MYAPPTALNRLRALVFTPAQVLPLVLAQLTALWLIVGAQLCNVIYGPSEGVREILRAARGAPV